MEQSKLVLSIVATVTFLITTSMISIPAYADSHNETRTVNGELVVRTVQAVSVQVSSKEQVKKMAAQAQTVALKAYNEQQQKIETQKQFELQLQAAAQAAAEAKKQAAEAKEKANANAQSKQQDKLLQQTQSNTTTQNVETETPNYSGGLNMNQTSGVIDINALSNYMAAAVGGSVEKWAYTIQHESGGDLTNWYNKAGGNSYTRGYTAYGVFQLLGHGEYYGMTLGEQITMAEKVYRSSGFGAWVASYSY